jgi:hypothetical protein
MSDFIFFFVNLLIDYVSNGNYTDAFFMMLSLSCGYGFIILVAYSVDFIDYVHKKPFTFWVLAVAGIPLSLFIHLIVLTAIVYGIATVISNIKKEWDIK